MWFACACLLYLIGFSEGFWDSALYGLFLAFVFALLSGPEEKVIEKHIPVPVEETNSES
jgi:hypothetical protein